MGKDFAGAHPDRNTTVAVAAAGAGNSVAAAARSTHPGTLADR